MRTLDLNRKARHELGLMRTLEELTGETTPALHRYLMLLGSRHPHPVDYDTVTEELRLHKSQVSRITRTLHKLSWRGAPGLDMVDIHFDLHNPRLKLVTLTEQGAARLAAMLSDEQDATQ